MSNIWGQYQAENKIQRFPMPIFKANKQVGRWVGVAHFTKKIRTEKSSYKRGTQKKTKDIFLIRQKKKRLKGQLRKKERKKVQ